MKIKKLITCSLLVILMLISLYSVKAEPVNLLENVGKWTGYFGQSEGWSDATGTFTSSNENSFTISMDSIGNANEWAVQAQLGNTTNLKSGTSYQYTSKITSDKTRKIYVKIQGTSDSDIIYENWIDVEKDKEYTLKEEFFVKKDYDNIKIFYAFGYNNQVGLPVNSSNNISVNSISLKESTLDYDTLEYNNVINGSTTIENYKYSSITGILGDVLAHSYPIDATKQSIYFPLIEPITKVLVNNQEINYYTNGGALAYITLDNFNKEFNDVTFFNNDNLVAKIIIKNENITIAKSNALTEIDSYLTNDSSDSIKSIITTAKNDVKKSETIDEVNEILTLLPAKIELQQIKDDTLEIVNSYLKDNSSKEVKKLINDTISNIENQSSKTEIENIKTQFIEEISLQLAREKAIDTLQNYLGTEYSDEVKAIYEKAKDGINNANTEEEIEEILSKAKNDIKEQINNENIKETENPVTLDNIYIYIIILIVAVVGIVFIIRYLRKQKKGK